MPSPIGHALGRALFGGLVAPRRDAAAADCRGWTAPGAAWWRPALLLGLVGMLPDLDFLFGLHSRYTHSVGAAVLAGVVGWWLSGRQLRWGVACAAAYGSHVLFDWLGDDTTPPIGVMALWPFSQGFYQSTWHLFPAIPRRYWLVKFWAHNLEAVAWELLLLGPPGGARVVVAVRARALDQGPGAGGRGVPDATARPLGPDP